ncbi:MAG: NfeD family protein [Gammaproteobacteria bacterium]|nr:NfeD family protein [Gammaproteobacteria bacterium]MDD9896025.1 NfeD family protein [Gammaproteobacteria bacterium]
MDFALLYWHWIVFGIALMLAEIFLGSFFIFWFGAAAIVVGLLMVPLPAMSVIAQIIIWAVSSAAFAIAWFKIIKPLNIDKTKAGLSKEALLGEIGQVLRVPNGEKRGKVRFPAPVLGSDEWLIISRDELDIGDRVSVTDLSGNALIVEKA